MERRDGAGAVITQLGKSLPSLLEEQEGSPIHRFHSKHRYIAVIFIDGQELSLLGCFLYICLGGDTVIHVRVGYFCLSLLVDRVGFFLRGKEIFGGIRFWII